MIDLPSADILACPPDPDLTTAEVLGESREGRPLHGWRLGDGPIHVSLIAGCHADEPVGPETLRRLVVWLSESPPAGIRWWIVPHANPDGEARNAAWSEHPVVDESGRRVFDLVRMLRHAVREPPGDDVEFGFPEIEEPPRPADAPPPLRPENRAVARFLEQGAPFRLHGSLHGMAFAAGPWFLLEEKWIERTSALRDQLRRDVAALGYGVHDVDRGGEKGFRRIDRGFTTRPDSRNMQRHFLRLGDDRTASLFRPSSMEWVRSRGGDPLTLVSEMPLFLGPPELWEGEDPVRPPELAVLRSSSEPREIRREAERLGIRAMPVEDQARLQLAFVAAALRTVG